MLNYRAIGRGFLVDITTTCLFAATLSVVLIDPGSSDASMAERIMGTGIIEWVCLLGGLSLTALGGFVCGRMVPNKELTHASAVGCLSLLAGIFLGGGTCPFMDWFTFTGLVLTVPVAQLGGVLAALYTAWSGAGPAD
ncbi:MAG: hypothetical protein WC314_03910 [Vulcanimicrobiota bacterium]